MSVPVDEPGQCGSCGAAILWGGTKNGKPQPLNAEPDPAGNIRFLEPTVFRATPRGALKAVEVITKAERESLFPPTGDRYMPHHATCPFAAQHRPTKAHGR